MIWSHSSARAIHQHERNVPDDVLELIGTEEGKTDAVVMVVPYLSRLLAIIDLVCTTGQLRS